MKLRFAALLIAAPMFAACGRSPVRLETRTYALHFLDEYRARRIMGPYVDSARPGAAGAISTTQGTLTVRETPDNLDRISRVLAQYDRPAPNVRLTFNVIQADGAARPDSAIRDIVATLRSLFRFQGYTLVAQGLVTGSENSGTRQVLAGRGGPYVLASHIQWISGSGDSASVQLYVELNFPGGGAFNTTVGVPVGKTAVLGNVKGGPPNGALILTVKPELLGS